MNPLDSIGEPDLCAWAVSLRPPCDWIQTTSPRFTDRLRVRMDTRMVAWGIQGGYLRIFAAARGMSWARRLIERYTRSAREAEKHFSSRETVLQASKRLEKV